MSPLRTKHVSVDVILNISHTRRLKKLLASDNHICKYNTKMSLTPLWTSYLEAGEKAQKRGQRYGCLGISPSEELCIGKWLRKDQGSGIARSHLFPKDLS